MKEIIFYTGVDLGKWYSNEAERADWNIYNVFQSKEAFSFDRMYYVSTL